MLSGFLFGAGGGEAFFVYHLVGRRPFFTRKLFTSEEIRLIPFNKLGTKLVDSAGPAPVRLTCKKEEHPLAGGCS